MPLASLLEGGGTANAVTEGVSYDTITYQYDTRGNILQKTFSLGETTVDTVNYGYTDAKWKDRLTSYNGVAITADDIGNPLNWINGETLTWQRGRQLASYTKNGKTTTFTYNDEGIRRSKTTGGVKTEYYVYDGTLRRMSDGTNTLQFVYGNGLSSVIFNGTEYWYVFNAQGDVIGLINASGSYVVEYTYDSWGKPLSKTGSLANTLGTLNPFRYRGYIYDEETGFYYVSSRYYDPAIGRWLNADDVAFLGAGGSVSYNLFVYCGNNPVMGYDPYGTFDFWGFVKGVGRVVTGITAVAVGVAVCVAGAPVAMVVAAVATITVGALTIANGAADIQQSVTTTKDNPTGGNYIRDTVFNENQTAYDIYSGATETAAIVGTAICGNYLSTNCTMQGAVPGTESKITLEPGTTLDRYGNQFGRYLTNPGTPASKLALPPSNSCNVTSYVVNRPFTFRTGVVAPCEWGPGGGFQYFSWMSVKRLVQFGFLTPLG